MRWIGMVIVAAATSVPPTAVTAQASNKPVVANQRVSLSSGNLKVGSVIVENTQARMYRDPDSGRTCDLTSKAEGVLWKLTLEGAEVDTGAVQVTGDKGVKFQHTCWATRGTVYTIDATGKRTGGGPRSEFMMFAPRDVKKVAIHFGGSIAEVTMPR